MTAAELAIFKNPGLCPSTIKKFPWDRGESGTHRFEAICGRAGKICPAYQRMEEYSGPITHTNPEYAIINVIMYLKEVDPNHRAEYCFADAFINLEKHAHGNSIEDYRRATRNYSVLLVDYLLAAFQADYRDKYSCNI